MISVQKQCICLLTLVCISGAGGKIFVRGMCRTFSTYSNFFVVFCVLFEGLSKIVSLRSVDNILVPPSFLEF
jgi:hypothetical protein